MLSFRTLLQLRHTLKTLGRIASALEAQNSYLKRLADEFAPEIPESSADQVKSAGPSFSRDGEQGKILDFCQKVLVATGRDPTDEEITDYLDGREVG